MAKNFENNMKILFINSSDKTGGASTVAFRLHLALKKIFNTNNYFIVGNKTLNHDFISSTRKNKLEIFIEKIIDRISSKLGFQYQFFPISSYRILLHARKIKPDLISLHNTHGGYFATHLLIKLSKIAPVVWTMHDMWAITANAAHTFEDTSWKSGKAGKFEFKTPPKTLINNGKWLINQKKHIYKKSNISIVTPSKWLFNLTIQSPNLQGKDKFHAFNGIDTTVFYPKDKDKLREKYLIPINSSVILFSGDGNLKNNPWKGGNDLEQILKMVDAKGKDLIFLVIGKGDLSYLNELKNIQYIKVGFVNNETEMANYFSVADLFIYPTLADNLPNTLVEAISCGLPCITSDIGGCNEIIIDGINGLVVHERNNEIFANKIIDLIGDKPRLLKMSEECRKIALKKFDSEKMAIEYYTIFNSILKENFINN